MKIFNYYKNLIIMNDKMDGLPIFVYCFLRIGYIHRIYTNAFKKMV